MNASAKLSDTFDLLNAVIQNLGVAVLPLWGVDDQGNCLCPKGEACKKARNAGKHPNGRLAPNGFKNATRDPVIIRQWLRQAPRSNWAVRCGQPLAGGGYLGVLDSDPRNGSVASLAELADRGHTLPDTVTDLTGRGDGGCHRFFRFAVMPESRSFGPGLDFQGDGKYVVIAPSQHFEGNSYHWELGMAPGEIAVADAPEWMQVNEATPRPTLDGGTARETILGEAFTLAGRAGAIMPDGTMFVDCVQSHMHSDSRGRGEDASTILLPPAGGSRFGGYKCQHGHCATLKWSDVLKQLPKEAVEAAFQKYPRLQAVPPPPVDDEAPTSPAEQQQAARDELAEMRQRLAFLPGKGGTFKIKQDIINLSIVLKYDPRWKGVLRYDHFSHVLRFAKEPPWHDDDKGAGKPEVWQDEDVTRLDLWLRRNWQLELKTHQIREAAYVASRRDGINPLQDYLNGLTWDGTPRLETMLVTYAGCRDTVYVRTIGRKWMLSAVARAMHPGCKVDTALILEGAQGKGKSTFLRVLATGSISEADKSSWFSDTAIDIGSKDALVALRGKWIIELAELASLRRADLDRVKAFFTSPVDSYRPPYGRELVTLPRSAVFAGTVNHGEYLHDTTGARRFWPVKVGVMDIDQLILDRDQLWAEAVALYKAWVARGSKQSEYLWWPKPEELPMFEEQQLARQVAGAVNPWIEDIARWVETEGAKKLLARQGSLTLRDVATQALRLDTKDLDHVKSTNIGLILARELGWVKAPAKVGGAKIPSWRPPCVGDDQ